MPAFEKPRLMLSGPGLIGKTHARILSAHDACDLVAIVAPDTEENRSAAQEFDVAFYSDFDAALEAEHIDGVIISSPNPFHFAQALACVKRGLPTLVEKPITDNVNQAARLVKAAEAAGVPLLVGHHRTYSTLLETALDFLRSNAFGRLVALQGAALFLKPDHYFVDGPWRTVKGGGPILINMIHEVGLMRELGGEIAAVHAIAGHDIRHFDVEDTVAISIKFASGALGTFMMSDTAASAKSWEMTSGENPAYPYFPQEACYHFAGTNGSLDFPSMRTKTYTSPAGRSWWKPFTESTLKFVHQDPLKVQINHFLDVIKGTARPQVSARDGYINMCVIEAIQKSIRTGRLVDVST